jgi:hypothetical protein
MGDIGQLQPVRGDPSEAPLDEIVGDPDIRDADRRALALCWAHEIPGALISRSTRLRPIRMRSGIIIINWTVSVSDAISRSHDKVDD